MELDTREALFPPHENRERPAGDGRFPELHLYHGSRCNRSCAFCTVNGSPDGWDAPFAADVLDAALRWVHPDGVLKVYGGEPTLDLPALLAALRFLRAGGFRGWFTIFSNGVLAERVIAILEGDAATEVVLNRSILYGEGAEPLPEPSRARLARYAAAHPGRLWCSHADLAPVGRLAAADDSRAFGGRCPHCYPVLTSRGELRACPFAVEHPLPHHLYGDTVLSPDAAAARHAEFLAWVTSVVELLAADAGRHPCSICLRSEQRPAAT